MNIGGIQTNIVAQEISCADYHQDKPSHQEGGREVIHLLGNRTHVQTSLKCMAVSDSYNKFNFVKVSIHFRDTL